MTDDVETTLASLEHRLRALQAELDDEPASAPLPPPAAAAHDEPADRFSGTVALEARTDLAGLAALHRGLGRLAGVRAVTLRTYAEGQATLDVTFDRFG